MELNELLNGKIKGENKEEFEAFRALILEYNQRYNLTTVLDEKDMYFKHFLDSAAGVELFKEDVDDVINTLNGYNYRGRSLTVSYARKKEDDSTEDKQLDADSVATSQAVSPAAEADTTEE
jgi:16S rRNA (guanine527-N7)-methyltransferase